MWKSLIKQLMKFSLLALALAGTEAVKLMTQAEQQAAIKEMSMNTNMH